MTEIPIYPPGRPPETPPEPGDWHGLWSGVHRSLARIAANLPDPRQTRREKAQAVWPVRIDPIPIPISGGVGFIDVPQILGPRLGRQWDVLTVSATGFTAGSVNGWINMPQISSGALQGALRAPFPQAGVINFGQNQCWLRYGERLVFVATGITGSVLVSLDATSIADEYVADYLI